MQYLKAENRISILKYRKLLKFQASPKFRQQASLPAVRPGSAGAGLQIFYKLAMYSCVRLTNFLIRDSSTVPPSFLLSIIGLPSSSLFH